jgi:outer membrane autotransporter protein
MDQALADGGAGGTGSGGTGGAGGASSTTGAGGAGGDSSQSNTGTTNGGGGGGGGAGATGGAGGHGAATAPPTNGAGGAGGASAGANGSTGTGGSSFGAGGGGGGAHGYVGATLPITNATGGLGGNGGNSTGGGGGGGAGGYGAVFTGTSTTGDIDSNMTGGRGGNGGNGFGSAGAPGGVGGDGGLGLALTGTTNNLTIDGTVTGGNGGNSGSGSNFWPGIAGDGGTGLLLGNLNTVTITGAVQGGNGGDLFVSGPGGTVGAGGAGIVGQNANVTITADGSVTGGLSGDESIQADAITFSGGTNTLTIEAGALISGDVVGTGSDTFVLGGSTNGSLDITAYQAQFTGFSTFGKSGTSTWSLTNGVISSPVDIDAGKLQFDTGALLGSNADVASGSTLSFNQTGTTTYGAVISGAGNFEQENAAGTVVFNTDQTYTGTTTITGTLQLGSGGTTGGISSSSDIVNNGALIVNRSNGITLGDVSGSGTLTKQAAGTLTFIGDTTFSSVSVTAGGLQVGNGGATGSIAGDIALSSGTTLTFNRTGTVTYADDVSGNGSFDNDGTGTTILTGAFTNTGTFAINSGTVQIGNGGSGGSVDLDIINDGTLVWNKTSNNEYTHAISGLGSLTKSGSGELNLTGINTYIGDTTITAGRLSVNGQIGGGASTTYVDGGVLGGTGTILGSVDVNAGGIHAPGNSIGTQTISGSYLLNSGAILQIEVNAARQSDQVIVGGTVNLTAAILEVIAAPGSYAPSTQYTIIDNQGGGAVNGTFTQITSSLAFLTPTVIYDGGDGNDVVLTLVNQGGVQFCQVATSTNQCAVANAVQQLGEGNPLYDAVLVQTAAGAQQAFNAMSGEIYASTASALIDQAHFVRGSILDRLIQSSYGGTSGTPVALGAGGPIAVAMRGRDPALSGRMALGVPEDTASDVPGLMPAYAEGLVFWTQAYGSWGQFEGNGNAATLDRSLGGFVSGVDTELHANWRAGVATGYTRTDLNVGARASSSDVNSYLLAAYAGGPVGEFVLRSGATWSWNTIDAQRNVVFPGFSEIESANYDGDVGQLFAELSHPYLHGGTAIEPFAGLAWVHFGTSGFTESGGVAALTTDGSSDNVGYSTLGLRAASTMPVHGVMVTPRASVAWQYAFGDTTPAMALAFAQSPAGFGILGVPLAQSSALIEAGVDLHLSADARLGVSYVGQLASDLQDNGVQASLRWRF